MADLATASPEPTPLVLTLDFTAGSISGHGTIEVVGVAPGVSGIGCEHGGTSRTMTTLAAVPSDLGLGEATMVDGLVSSPLTFAGTGLAAPISTPYPGTLLPTGAITAPVQSATAPLYPFANSSIGSPGGTYGTAGTHVTFPPSSTWKPTGGSPFPSTTPIAVFSSASRLSLHPAFFSTVLLATLGTTLIRR